MTRGRITPAMVADMCGVSKHTVYGWRKRGLLKSYEPKDVAQFLNTRWKMEVLKELSQWLDDKKMEVQ